ncbi:MAG: hypothetical protein VX681_05205 [Myxococcota bacterium]|nr:hypothetical protein [Myxococcota bacterium]
MKNSSLRALAQPHKAAGLAYGVLGVLVIVITFTAELIPPTREGAYGQLAVGAVFVLIFAVLLYRQGWWLLSALLVVPNVWRATNYFHHGLGLHVDPLALSITTVSPRPAAFVNAALMTIVVSLLVRSAWIGFSAWRTQRRIGEEQ